MTLIAQELLTHELAEQSGAPAGPVDQDSSWSLLSLLTLARAVERESLTDQQDVGALVNRDVLRALLLTLHHRDPAIVQHSRHVAALAVGLAEHLGWEGRELQVLEVGALLHDLGKVGVPDNILGKPAELSPDEAELLAAHYGVGISIMQACGIHQDVIDLIIRSQPQLSPGESVIPRVGEQTHLGSRLLAVVDAYESLTSPQSYRDAFSHENAIGVLDQTRQFDDNLVLALKNWIERNGLPYRKEDRAADRLLPMQPALTHEQSLEVGSLCQIFSQLYMLESLYDGFLLIDNELRIRVWNRGLERLLGHPAASMRGSTWSSELIDYRDANGNVLDESQSPMVRALESRKAVLTRLTVPRTDSRALSVELQTVPLIDRHGRIRGVAEIYRDLTRETRRKTHELRELKLAASRDALTSVANRGELEAQLASMMQHFTANASEKFCVIFVDADHFKSINDTYGHAAGDQVLVTLSRVLEHETYSGELIGRYGGEEFLVLCPGVDLEAGVRRAERLRWAIRNLRIRGLEALRLTASFGVAESEAGDTVESLLRRADKALYKAKESGRDRTCSIKAGSRRQGADGTTSSSEMPVVDAPPHDPYVYRSSFNAVIAADMVIYKLAGFIDDHKAELKTVTTERVVLNMGGRAWLWADAVKDMPVEVELVFGQQVSTPEGRGRSRTDRTSIQVTVRPRGRQSGADAFRLRAELILRNLRQFFVCDHSNG